MEKWGRTKKGQRKKIEKPKKMRRRNKMRGSERIFVQAQKEKLVGLKEK